MVMRACRFKSVTDSTRLSPAVISADAVPVFDEKRSVMKLGENSHAEIIPRLARYDNCYV